MEFVQKDNLGLERTYYVITNIEVENEEYVIYSDLINDKEHNKEFRILVGQIEVGKVIRCDKVKEKHLIECFKYIEDEYKNSIKELI